MPDFNPIDKTDFVVKEVNAIFLAALKLKLVVVANRMSIYGSILSSSCNSGSTE